MKLRHFNLKSFAKSMNLVRRIRDITKEVAAAVVKEAVEEDLAEGYRDIDARELQKICQSQVIWLLICKC